MCRKSQETQKEMKLVLDVYKGAAKDLRDKVEVHKCTCNLIKLLLSLSVVQFFPLTLRTLAFVVQLLSEEKRLREQIEEQKARIESLEKELEKHKGALADEEAIRRLKMAEETIEQLQKNLAATKQVQLLILPDVLFSTFNFTHFL